MESQIYINSQKLFEFYVKRHYKLVNVKHMCYPFKFQSSFLNFCRKKKLPEIRTSRKLEPPVEQSGSNL